jgi:hypothetical protein
MSCHFQSDRRRRQLHGTPMIVVSLFLIFYLNDLINETFHVWAVEDIFLSGALIKHSVKPISLITCRPVMIYPTKLVIWDRFICLLDLIMLWLDTESGGFEAPHSLILKHGPHPDGDLNVCRIRLGEKLVILLLSITYQPHSTQSKLRRVWGAGIVAVVKINHR